MRAPVSPGAVIRYYVTMSNKAIRARARTLSLYPVGVLVCLAVLGCEKPSADESKPSTATSPVESSPKAQAAVRKQAPDPAKRAPSETPAVEVSSDQAPAPTAPAPAPAAPAPTSATDLVVGDSVVLMQGRKLYVRPADDAPAFTIPSRAGDEIPLGLHFSLQAIQGQWLEVHHDPTAKESDHCVRLPRLRDLPLRFFVKKSDLAWVTRRDIERATEDGTRISLGAGVMLQSTKTPDTWQFLTEDLRLPVTLGKGDIGQSYRPGAFQKRPVPKGMAKDKARRHLQRTATVVVAGQSVKRAFGSIRPRYLMGVPSTGKRGPPTVWVSAIGTTDDPDVSLARVHGSCAVAVVRTPTSALQERRGPGAAAILGTTVSPFSSVEVQAESPLTWVDGTPAVTTPAGTAQAFDIAAGGTDAVQCLKVPLLLGQSELDPLTAESPPVLCVGRDRTKKRQSPFESDLLGL